MSAWRSSGSKGSFPLPGDLRGAGRAGGFSTTFWSCCGDSVPDFSLLTLVTVPASCSRDRVQGSGGRGQRHGRMPGTGGEAHRRAAVQSCETLFCAPGVAVTVKVWRCEWVKLLSLGFRQALAEALTLPGGAICAGFYWLKGCSEGEASVLQCCLRNGGDQASVGST